ncbi:MAG: AMP-binding protein [Huintestinicola sp.]
MNVQDVHMQYVKEEFDEKGIIKSFELVLPDNFNFAYDIVDAIADIDPSGQCLVWCDDEGREQTFTFGEISALSSRAANLFIAKGIKKGDRIMAVLKRHWQIWVVAYALEKIGAVLVPATCQLKKKDYVYRFAAGDIKGIIASGDGDITENIDLALAEYKGMEHKLIVKCDEERDGWENFDRLLYDYPETIERIPTATDEDFLMFFSSGTTGYPKMVMHSHSYSAAHIPTAKYWHGVKCGGLHFTISESGWGKFFWGKIFGQIALGAAVLAYDFDKFVPADVLSCIEKYRPDTLCCPPTMYRFFIKEGMGGHDLSSVRHASTAGEALNGEVYDRFLEYTGLPLMEGYGQTETVLIIGNPVGSEPRSGVMGKAMPMFDVIVADADNKEVPDGTEGEICVRLKNGKNYGLLKGYINNPQESERAFSGGLYHTGDMAFRDSEGYFHYVGRTDDVIKSSGYRIGPFEIESVLMEHPAVLETAVTAVPDPIRGQVVKATIVLTSEYKNKAGDELAKELKEFVKKNTAPYKYPRIIEFAESLPKTISGKIRRAEIRKNDSRSTGDPETN